MPTAQEVYDDTVRTLSASERLRLAALILTDLSQSAAPILDYSDSWTDEDIHDLAAFSAQHAASSYRETDEIA